MVSGGLVIDQPSTLSGRLRVARECMLYLFGLRQKYKVANHSMKPALHSGDFVIVDTNAFDTDLPRAHDIVVALHPTDSSMTIIKRIERIDTEDRIHLASDNLLAGQDSRHFGPVSRDLLIGRVTAVIN